MKGLVNHIIVIVLLLVQGGTLQSTKNAVGMKRRRSGIRTNRGKVASQARLRLPAALELVGATLREVLLAATKLVTVVPMLSDEEDEEGETVVVELVTTLVVTVL